ncbi:hypothetical protein HPB49_005503 [Dermacentor silvarum]|uniref:Uncharacterized protein n=1 Tax=Dermacentor silvarum TaxID=543639 RepID=A0ACB8DVB1_DERSI|nr:hypothetical protein HPB49_005503 [Dermacentor silvarum]
MGQKEKLLWLLAQDEAVIEVCAERVYRGAFTVVEGDKFSDSLSNSLAEDFVHKADAYRAKLDRLFNSSTSGFRGTEVIAFQRRADRELTVHFNAHFALGAPLDAGDLYLVVADELLRGRLGVFRGLKCATPPTGPLRQMLNLYPGTDLFRMIGDWVHHHMSIQRPLQQQ